MNYKESIEILNEVKRAKNILLNCHRGPDPDSIGSSLAMYRVLKQMDKNVRVVCPSEELYNTIDYLENFKVIEKNVDFTKLDFSKFELFITLDSSSWDMVTGLNDFVPPKVKIAVIDHHATNTGYGDINLVDTKVTSVGELLYYVLEDWKSDIDKETATCLLTGIIGDTGSFRFPGETARTLEIGSKLMKLGADKDKITFNIYHRADYKIINFYGEVLTRARLDKEHKFIWSEIPYAVCKKLGQSSARESAASYFAQITEGTDFGFLICEEEKKVSKVSFRSRTGVDTSKIAHALGGGGHAYASGATVRDMSFDKACELIVYEARKFAKGNAPSN